MRLVFLTLAWVVGILYAASDPIGALPLWIAAALLAAVLALLLRRFELLVICAAILGILRFSVQPTSSEIAAFNDSGFVILEGVIAAEPDQRDSGVQLRLAVDTVLRRGETKSINGMVLVIAPSHFEGAFGSRIRAAGVLETPSSGDLFSYSDYLARADIFSLMPRAQVALLAQPTESSFRASLITYKQDAEIAIARHLPEPHASLLSGILLGDDKGLSPEVRDSFAETGAAHVIAISGFNMAILGGFVSRLLHRVRINAGFQAAISVTVIMVYALFVGASPGVMRAAFMTSLVFVAEALRRRTYQPASLAFAVLVLSALDPLILWDIGFQLSVFAVLGLALFAKPFAAFHDRLFSGLPRPLKPTAALLRESVAVSLAALTFTLPLSALHFGRLSPAVLIVNALIVPVQPAVMLFGGLGLLFAAVVPALAAIPLWLAMLPLLWTTGVVRLFAQLPDQAVYPAPGWIAGAFAVIIAIAVVRAARPEWIEAVKQKSPLRTTLYGLLVASGLLFTLAALVWVSRPDGLLHLWFFDFAGSTVLIQTPQGAHILIDGGAYPSRLLTAVGDRLPFYDRSIDLQFITQPDAALISALPAFYERYQPELTILNGDLGGDDALQPLAERLDQWLRRQAISGEVFQTTDGVALRVVSAASQPLDLNSSDAARDAQALVLEARYQGVNVLFTGQLSIEGQRALMTSGALSFASILQIPRGASSILAEGFAAAVSPSIAVAQNDTLRRSRSPVQDALTGFPAVYRTDQVGTIHVYTDGSTIWIEGEHTPTPS